MKFFNTISANSVLSLFWSLTFLKFPPLGASGISTVWVFCGFVLKKLRRGLHMCNLGGCLSFYWLHSISAPFQCLRPSSYLSNTHSASDPDGSTWAWPGKQTCLDLHLLPGQNSSWWQPVVVSVVFSTADSAVYSYCDSEHRTSLLSCSFPEPHGNSVSYRYSYNEFLVARVHLCCLQTWLKCLKQ